MERSLATDSPCRYIFRQKIFTTLVLLMASACQSATALELYGLNDISGKEILPCKYAEIRDVDYDQYVITPMLGGPNHNFDFLIEKSGVKILRELPAKLLAKELDVPYEIIADGHDGVFNHSLKHRDGRTIIEPTADILFQCHFLGDGMYKVSRAADSGNREILLNEHGVVAELPSNVEFTGDYYSCGLKQIVITEKVIPDAHGPGQTTISRHGFIDRSGRVKFVLPLDNYSSPFSDGFTSYFDKDGDRLYTVLLSASGQTAKCEFYYRVLPFKGNRAVVVNADNRYGMIDKSGKVLIAPTHDFVEDFGSTILVKSGGTFSLFNQGCLKLFDLPDGTNSVQPCGDNGWYPYSVGGIPPESGPRNEPYEHAKFGFIDGTGVVKITPRFNSANAFSHGFALVSNPLFGSIDETASYAVQPAFQKAKRIRDQIVVSNEVEDFSFETVPDYGNLREFAR